jgi:hypothetical protein
VITRLAKALMKWHATKAYLAALFGRDEESSRQERLHDLAKKIVEQEQ